MLKQKKSKLNIQTKGYILGLVVGLGLGASTGINLYKTFSSRVIPTTTEVQQGYVNPSKLEIKLKDLDGDGTKETLIKYDGTQYLLKLNNGGDAQIKAYKISLI